LVAPGDPVAHLRNILEVPKPALQSILRVLKLRGNTPRHGKDDQHGWLVVGSLKAALTSHA
jgi:hypothetical protein